MRKAIYYLVLIAVFFGCITLGSFIIVGIEELFNIRIGMWLKYTAVWLELWLFITIRSIVHKLFFKDDK